MTIQQIKKLVETRFNLTMDTKSRKREIVYARAVYYKLCSEYTSKTLTDIGDVLNRDHATVCYGLNLFNNIQSMNKVYKDNQYSVYLELKHKFDTLERFKQKDYEPDVYYKNKYRIKLLQARDLYNFNKRLLKQLDLMDYKYTDKVRGELDNILNIKQND